MARESRRQKTILEFLNKLPWTKAVKIDTMGENGTPDVLCCHYGHTILIEVKNDDGRPNQAQLHRHDQWRKTGATVVVVRNVEEVKQIDCLNWIDNRVLKKKREML